MIDPNWKPKPLFDLATLGAQPAQQSQQPARRGGVGGFLEDTARSIVHPFSYYANTTFGLPIRQISAELTGNKQAYKNAEDEINREFTLRKILGNGAQALATVATLGSGSALKAGGASLGKRVGLDATLGSIYGTGEAFAHDKSTSDALKQGALSGVLSGGISGLSGAFSRGASKVIPEVVPKSIPTTAKSATKIVEGEVIPSVAEVPLKTSVRGRVEDLGNKLLASQYGTIGKPIARATQPLDTIGKLADIGVTKPHDAERLAHAVTGSEGIINKAVLKATSGAKPVDTSGLSQVVDDAIENYGLVDKDAKSVRAIARAQIKRLTGGPQGSLSGNGDPNDTLTVIKSIEKRIADLTGKGENYRLTSPERLDQAHVLGLFRDELTDRLYSAAGANENVSKVLTPEFRNQLLSLYPDNNKWAKFVDDTVMKSSGIKELRGTMAPFVRIGKIIDEGDINAITFGGRVGNNFGTVRDKILDYAASNVARPAARVAGDALRTASKAGDISIVPQGLDKVLASAPVGNANRLFSGAIKDGLSNTTAGRVLAPNAAPAILNNQSPQFDTQSQYASFGDLSSDRPIKEASLSNEQSGSSPYDLANVQQNIQGILSQGGKQSDVNDYIQTVAAYQKLYAKDEKQPDSPFSRPSAAQYTQAVGGLRSISELEKILSSNPRIVGKNAIPGQGVKGIGSTVSSALGTSKYRAITRNILNSISRINTGANMPESEVRFYEETYFPQPNDPEDTRMAKIENLKSFFVPLISYQGQGSGSGLDASLASLNY